MIKHDEKVLQELFNEYVTTNPDAGVGIIDQDSAIDIMREYLAHMIRWRTMDEVPEIGGRIEVVYQCEADQPHWSAIDIYSSEGFIDDNPYLCRVDEIGHPCAWRPVGELPEVSDVA